MSRRLAAIVLIAAMLSFLALPSGRAEAAGNVSVSIYVGGAVVIGGAITLVVWLSGGDTIYLKKKMKSYMMTASNTAGQPGQASSPGMVTVLEWR